MRRRNWMPELVRWAERLVGQPFAWGVTDCHALARDAYAILYGRSLDLPAWTSDREALALYREGWALPLARLGARPVPLGFLQCGDLVVEPRGEHFHAVWVALGEGRFLTSQIGDVVRLAPRAAVDDRSIGWRWP